MRASAAGGSRSSAALGTGTPTPWDYAPPYDASRRYIRNHMDLGDLEATARYPTVKRAQGR